MRRVSAIITLLASEFVDESVATYLTRGTIRAAAVARSSIAVVTYLFERGVDHAVAAFLVGRAVLAAAIARDDITVVAHLIGADVDDSIATKAGDAGVLIGGTDRAGRADESTRTQRRIVELRAAAGCQDSDEQNEHSHCFREHAETPQKGM
jgi:hypothetical protein